MSEEDYLKMAAELLKQFGSEEMEELDFFEFLGVLRECTAGS